MKTSLTLGLLMLVSVPSPAQERRAPDPRLMGGGDCRDNVYNCADARSDYTATLIRERTRP